MKKYLTQLLLFSLPVLIAAAFIIWMDFFKIFGFQDYYADQKVGINRGVVTTTTYNHFREEENFNSFIFGSSRSQAYKCKNWARYLDDKSRPFHFDAAGETVWGVAKKIEYIDGLGDTIRNALLIMDRALLRLTYPREGLMYIPMPCISKFSKLKYYYAFLNASLNIKFLIAYLDYSIFKKPRGYMGNYIRSYEYDDTADKINCDIWLGWDKEIETDSLGYYDKLIRKGVFYERPPEETKECNVKPGEIAQLKTIKKIFDKHHTNYKIVLSPVYDQVPVESDQVKLLEDIFGQENIYNFSGKNKFTEPVYNYYEASHYRPHVANEILEIVYQ